MNPRNPLPHRRPAPGAAKWIAPDAILTDELGITIAKPKGNVILTRENLKQSVKV